MKSRYLSMLVITTVFILAFSGCNNKTVNYTEKKSQEYFKEIVQKEYNSSIGKRYNSKLEVQEFLNASGLEEKYPSFVFSIGEVDEEIYGEERFYLDAASPAWDFDIGESIVELANEKEIHAFVSAGSIFTCWATYQYDGRDVVGWSVLGNDLVEEKFEYKEGIYYTKEEIKDFLNKYKNELLTEDTIIFVLISAYNCVEETEEGQMTDFSKEYAKILVDYYEDIMKYEEYIEERTVDGEIVYYHYYAPEACVKSENSISFFYSNEKTLTINYLDWTSIVGELDRTVNIKESANDVNVVDLEQQLFDSINYALSIGLTTNCDMSQETLKQIYEKIEDGSFFSESMFSYVTEYGKDQYNYVISYDSLALVVYCDYITGLYGFEILETE